LTAARHRAKLVPMAKRRTGLGGGNPDSERAALKSACGYTVSYGDCGPWLVRSDGFAALRSSGALQRGWRVRQGGATLICEAFKDEAITSAFLRCPRARLHRSRY
jgi:hypothetical protein